MKPTAEELIRAAPAFLGTPYSRMDCQAFVEAALRKIGIDENLAGSNAWYRHMTWTGTPEECKASFGRIPPGAFLFILSDNGKEPEKYKPDGIGNASHIGIYTGLTGAEMVKLAKDAGVVGAAGFDFGNGAIHSSQKHQSVCTSSFSGRTISGGWNRVGLWDKLGYDIDIDWKGDDTMMAKVNGPDGETVFLRPRPTTKASFICRVPSGATVEVLSQSGDWSYVRWDQDEKNTYQGYMMSQFLTPIADQPNEDGTIPVQYHWLMGLRQQAIDLQKQIDGILEV